MFLMWGYEGEELDDIAATVDHVKASNPDIFFTTVSYPIKGTGYFEKVRERVTMPIAWAEGSDRDYVIAGRHGSEYYRLADHGCATRSRHSASRRRSGASGGVVRQGVPGAGWSARLERRMSSAQIDLAAVHGVACRLRPHDRISGARTARTPRDPRRNGTNSNGRWPARSRPCRASRYCWPTACAGVDRHPGRRSSPRSASLH